MRSTLISRAPVRSRPTHVASSPRRTAIDAAAVVVVLALLFAATIMAALHARPLVAATQAAVEGGL